MAVPGTYLQAADALLVHLRKDPLFEINVSSKTQDMLYAEIISHGWSILSLSTARRSITADSGFSADTAQGWCS